MYLLEDIVFCFILLLRFYLRRIVFSTTQGSYWILDGGVLVAAEMMIYGFHTTRLVDHHFIELFF